jgi:hypothetical protein
MKHLIAVRKSFFSKHFNPNSIFQLIMAVLLVGAAFAPTQAAFAAGTFTVNRADDIAPRGAGVTCITAASSDCTLREAVIKANANPPARPSSSRPR